MSLISNLNTKNLKYYLSLLLLIFLTLNCKKDNITTPPPSLPIVNTTSISSIAPISAVAGGDVTNDGGAKVTTRGVCWSNSPNPLFTGNHSTDGAGSGTFSSSISGLNPGTLYYLRAYASNSVGTAYGNEISFTTSIPDVYTAGHEYNGNSISVAKVWKNGVATSLSTGLVSTQSWARDVCVSGADVHVVGYEFNGMKYTAKLWKNGISTSLTNGNYDAQALAVRVSGVDIYAAGYENNASGKAIAKLWKNGISTSLSDGTNDAQVNGIFIFQPDIYAVGFEIISGTSIAKLWKNGVATTLPSTGTSNTAYRVYVSGNNVYVVGNGITPAGYSKVILWTNGMPEDLTTGFSSIAIPYGVYVNGADVYVAGFDQSTGTGIATAILWKNGIPNSLTDGTNYARANSVYVYNNDVYVTGYERVWPISISRTWKNGTVIHSTNGSFNAASSSVFVK